MPGTLLVSHHPDAREVMIVHQDILLDENGVGHIIFSPTEAVGLAQLLMRHAEKACRITVEDYSWLMALTQGTRRVLALEVNSKGYFLRDVPASRWAFEALRNRRKTGGA